MSDDLLELLRRGPEYIYRYVDADHKAADRIEQLERDLKTVLDREAATYERHDAKVEALERERDASTLRIKQLSDALEHARDSLLWCARGGRMASHGLEQYPEKWAASATAVLEQRG